ncbi:hypothetical protein [Streptomyces sp. NBC_00342]|uniref:hypothetical protein n=1 Tax=Streptomyces sp. NBC_00342 TaxID=2975718 RepID=UPI002E28CE83|nr:hypothetical protein [Streptomyces sp. NBC_00342]
MADPMAPDDVLRACGYLEAVWREDAADMAALLTCEPGETATAVLLAELGDNIMQRMFPPQFGVRDGLSARDLADAAERMSSDPTVRVSTVLLETLKAIAVAATPDQAEIVARSLIEYLLAISDATPDDVLPMLHTLRQSALQRDS